MIIAESRDYFVARCPVFDTHTYFDKFVMRERRLIFCENRFRQTGVTNHQQRLELVPQAA